MHLRSSPRRVAGVAAALAAVAVGLAVLSAPARADGSAPCWQRLIADWSDNGTIERHYSTACYLAAERNAPTDLRIYSTLEDDLARALQSRAARHVTAVAPHRTLAAAAALPGSSSSSFALLTALLAGLGALLGAVWLGSLLVRRRR